MKFRHNMVWIGCLLAATHACALTLGPTQGQVVLGAPLDIRIAVEPDADQTLESSCIDADALFGAVRAHTTLELVPPSTIRLRSRQAVNEPLVHLQVSAGCNGSSVRSYTLFADPPAGVGTKPAVTAQQPLPLATAVLPATAAAAPAKRRAPSAPKNTPRSATKTPKAAKATPPAPTATASSAASAASAATTATAAAAVPLSNLTLESIENSRPVLRMDTLFLFPDTEGSETSPRTSTADSTVALPSPSHADTERATSEQLQQLEKQLTALVQQQQRDRARILLLSEQLTHSQQQAPATLWLYGLMALLVLALTTIAVLLHRLRSIQSRKQADWSDTVRQAQDDAAPEAPPSIAVSQEPTKAKAKNPDAPAATDTTAQELRAFLPAAAPPDLWEQAEAPAPAPASLAKTDTEAAPSPLQVRQANAFILPTATNVSTPTPPQPPVSAYSTITSQDFLNAQEQAEFFASIGEYDEAIGLLQQHIAEVGPVSPLPYLKLLEFFYQLSRSEPFEQTRQALQEHFNIDVPVLSHYHEPGADLLDGYPQLLEPIEAQWPSDAVLTLLEHLLHYPVQGKFDVTVPRLAPAAFRDVLLLHSMALNTTASSRGSMERRHSTVAQAVAPAVLNAVVPPASLPSDSPVADPAAATTIATDADAALLTTLDLNFELPETPPAPLALAADSTPHADVQAPALAPHLEDLQLDWHQPEDPSATGQPPAQTPPATPEAPLLDLNLDGLQLEPPADPRPPRQP